MKKNHGIVLTSVSAEVSDQGLINFTAEANRKRGYRLMDMLPNQPPPSDRTLHQPVCVSLAEREKYSSVESLAVADIGSEILDIIDCMNESCQEVYLTNFRKIEYDVQFLNEISRALTEQLPQLDNAGIPGMKTIW